MSNEEKKDCKVEDNGEDYLKDVPIVQLYSPEQWHGEQAMVMNETGRTALVSALLSKQHVLPVFCSDGEGGYLLLITEPTTGGIDQYHKPYIWDVARDSSRAIKDPRLDLTKAEYDLAQKGEHMLVRAPEYKHVVKISIKAYLDWRFASASDAEDAFDFIGTFFQYGWLGVQNEYKTLADFNKDGAGHGYLPDYIFTEGFGEAQKLCSGDDTTNLYPDSGEAASIAVVWVD